MYTRATHCAMDVGLAALAIVDGNKIYRQLMSLGGRRNLTETNALVQITVRATSKEPQHALS